MPTSPDPAADFRPGEINHPDVAFKELLKRSAAILRAHGFKGSGQNYTRDCGEVWQVVNFQKSMWSVQRDHLLSFYINLSAYLPFDPARPASEDDDGTKPWYHIPKASKLRASYGDVRFRSGELHPDDRDGFDLGDDNFDAVWRALEHRWYKVFVPVLDAIRTRNDLVRLTHLQPWMVDRNCRAKLGDEAPPRWESNEERAKRLQSEFYEYLQSRGARYGEDDPVTPPPPRLPPPPYRTSMY
ncbi:MAG: DUF4304 domain-containing protein [Phycisphaerales bacterium]|nr:MAG: DUF4304 domain-containing protein [Phycisphaerales bacterium]